MPLKVGMVSLGCPKNQVDAEILLHDLKRKGYFLVSDATSCDAVIINTCGFIQSAQEEAIEQIMEYVALKKEGKVKAIVVTGCLAERFREDILTEIPEVDAVVGIGSNGNICAIIDHVMKGNRVQSFGEKEDLSICGGRVLTTQPYFAYLKIAEGCDNCCTYCAIPQIRGKYRSRPMEEVIKEAKWLADQGVKELILVAQDTTRYGEDLYGEYYLAKLLRELCKIDKFIWIRLLYCYPDKITDELLITMAEEPKIAKYLDIPLQHCNDYLLGLMNRKMKKEELVFLIDKIRDNVPGVTLRTTLIAGFPSETETQFEELVEFVKVMRFDHLGCFAYSAEEGTKAAEFQPQVPMEIRQRRAEIIMEEQMTIVQQDNELKKDLIYTVVVEGYNQEADYHFGRAEGDAPDIDGRIYFVADDIHTIGEFVPVKITGIYDYELLGEEFRL